MTRSIFLTLVSMMSIFSFHLLGFDSANGKNNTGGGDHVSLSTSSGR